MKILCGTRLMKSIANERKRERDKKLRGKTAFSIQHWAKKNGDGSDDPP